MSQIENAIEVFASELISKIGSKCRFTNDSTECEVYYTLAAAVREALEAFKRELNETR